MPWLRPPRRAADRRSQPERRPNRRGRRRYRPQQFGDGDGGGDGGLDERDAREPDHEPHLDVPHGARLLGAREGGLKEVFPRGVPLPSRVRAAAVPKAAPAAPAAMLEPTLCTLLQTRRVTGAIRVLPAVRPREEGGAVSRS
jgi:hypothetical protein